MEVGEELARRGHQVTVVSPHKYKKVPQGISDIVIPSEFDEFTTGVTLEFLTNPNTQLPISGVSRLSSLSSCFIPLSSTDNIFKAPLSYLDAEDES